MPRNPFANPLFLPVFLRVMLLIVVGLAAVLLAQRRSLKVWRRSTLFLRARTWFVIGPLFVLAVFIGGFVAFLLATFVVVQGCSEFARIAGIERRYAYLLILWGELGLLVAALARDFFGFLPFGFFIALTLLPILSGQITDAHRQVADTLVGYVFVALPMAYIVLVKSAEPYGLEVPGDRDRGRGPVRHRRLRHRVGAAGAQADAPGRLDQDLGRRAGQPGRGGGRGRLAVGGRPARVVGGRRGRCTSGRVGGDWYGRPPIQQLIDRPRVCWH